MDALEAIAPADWVLTQARASLPRATGQELLSHCDRLQLTRSEGGCTHPRQL
jgi:hypothetical protein